jgi:hypothetical protein
MTSQFTEHGLPEAEMRKGSVGAVNLTDDKGRRRTIMLEDLSAADRELAEKFGYAP